MRQCHLSVRLMLMVVSQFIDYFLKYVPGWPKYSNITINLGGLEIPFPSLEPSDIADHQTSAQYCFTCFVINKTLHKTSLRCKYVYHRAVNLWFYGVFNTRLRLRRTVMYARDTTAVCSWLKGFSVFNKI